MATEKKVWVGGGEGASCRQEWGTQVGEGSVPSPVALTPAAHFWRSFFPSFRYSKLSIWLCDDTSALGDKANLLLMGNTAPLNHLCFSHVGASAPVSIQPRRSRWKRGKGRKEAEFTISGTDFSGPCSGILT